MTRHEYYLRVILAVLPGILSRNNPSALGAAIAAEELAGAVLQRETVQEALALLEEQTQPKRVHATGAASKKA